MGQRIFGTVNTLEKRGISKDADNAVSQIEPEETKLQIFKITNQELLKYGQETLEKMQDEHLAELKAEHDALGTEVDRSLE